jgi:hypothetical protein
MPFPVRVAFRAVAAAIALLATTAVWSANLWFIQDTPLGTMNQEDREMYKRTLDEELDFPKFGQGRARAGR